MPDCLSVKEPTSLLCIPYFISNIVNFAMTFSAIATVFFIVIAGIRFMSSGGDPVRLGKAKATFTYALMGLFIVLLSFSIMMYLGRVLGIDCKILGLLSCK